MLDCRWRRGRSQPRRHLRPLEAEVIEMLRAPLAAAAVLVAGLALAACGAAPVQHPSASHTSTSPSAKTGVKATPSPTATKPLSAAEQGFRNWAQAAVLLTGGGPSGLPVSSMPKAEADLMLIDKGLHFPGWLHSIGQGLVLQEIPAGCEATTMHVVGEFATPANAPVVVGAGKIAIVVRAGGKCLTQAGGVKYLTEPAAGSIIWVLLGSFVTLPPVAGLPGLPTTVWSPAYRSSCTSGFVLEQGSLFPSGVVPGC